MIKLLQENNVNADVLVKAWEYNTAVREEKDWKKIKGAMV